MRLGKRALSQRSVSVPITGVVDGEAVESPATIAKTRAKKDDHGA
jgi:hypothetical protein